MPDHSAALPTLNAFQRRVGALLVMAVTANRFRMVYKKRRSEDRVNDPRLPVRSRTLILPRCPEARGNIDSDLNTDPKVLRTLGPRWRDPYGSRLRTIKRFSGRRL